MGSILLSSGGAAAMQSTKNQQTISCQEGRDAIILIAKNSYNMILSFHLFWLIVTWPTLQTKHRKTPLFLSICWQRWMWGRLCYPIQRLPATNITGHQTPEAKLVERKICGSPLLQCQAGRQSIPPVDVNNNAPSRCLIYIAHRPALL